jgi:hypothetical protein
MCNACTYSGWRNVTLRDPGVKASFFYPSPRHQLDMQRSLSPPPPPPPPQRRTCFFEKKAASHHACSSCSLCTKVQQRLGHTHFFENEALSLFEMHKHT